MIDQQQRSIGTLKSKSLPKLNTEEEEEENKRSRQAQKDLTITKATFPTTKRTKQSTD